MHQQPQYTYYAEDFPLEERPRRFLEAFAAILRHSNYGPVLDTYVHVSAKCSLCTAACPVYQATGDSQDIPCHRSELLLRIYRRYFTLGGSLRARFLDSFHLNDEYIDTMAEAFYRCTACKRCLASCPMGIDHALVTHLARWVLSEIGIVPKALLVSVREQLEGETRNTSAIPKVAMLDTCEFLEEELEEIYPGAGITFPIDVEDAEYVFFPAVSDYLLEADTLMGNAAMLHAIGASWTIGSENFDGIDYGLFYSDRMWERIITAQVAEIKRLGGRAMLIGECGHASRSAKEGMQNFIPASERVPVINIMELAHANFLSGKLRLIENAITERTTYHDPCNIARKGWIVEQPREILRHICSDFVEMTPHGVDNYCCGGGGGTVSIDEIRGFRVMVGGQTKAEQIKATGAHYVVTPCANCKKQVSEIIEDFELDVVRTGLHDLFLQAIIMPDGQRPEPRRVFA
ncbi:MAG: (Fe-S)-binding protein [Thermoanaerobaculales bacterium]|jgi:Fe-S oxidoreductase|nr:(Fe-S)-binding protein [Thermoanaerobaculales bacterium]